MYIVAIVFTPFWSIHIVVLNRFNLVVWTSELGKSLWKMRLVIKIRRTESHSNTYNASRIVLNTAKPSTLCSRENIFARDGVDEEVLRLDSEGLHDLQLVVWICQLEVELLDDHCQRHDCFLHRKRPALSNNQISGISIIASNASVILRTIQTRAPKPNGCHAPTWGSDAVHIQFTPCDARNGADLMASDIRTGRASNLPSSILSGLNSSAWKRIYSSSDFKY